MVDDKTIEKPSLNFLKYFFKCPLFLVVRPEGKGSRPHVFSLVPNSSMRVGPLLDIAANSQEELKEWIFKIHDVAQTSEAKVKTASSQMAASCECTVRRIFTVELQSHLEVVGIRNVLQAGFNRVNTSY